MSKKPVGTADYGRFRREYLCIRQCNWQLRKPPNLDRLFATCPHTLIGASGLDVGLPDGQMGNSEVGHTNIGAGPAFVYQMLVKITKDIADGDFFKKPALVHSMENARDNGTALHLMGLLSPGGVHSHQEHLYGLLPDGKELRPDQGLCSCFPRRPWTFRRPPQLSICVSWSKKMKEIGVGSVCDHFRRYYAMDRDNAWDRVEKAYDAMVMGEGVQAECPVAAIEDSYKNGVTDEFMLPTVVNKDGMIGENDSVIFFNFRPDRARQITRAYVDPDFKGFERKKGFFHVHFVCMAQYDATMPGVEVAYPPEALTMTYGEYIASKGNDPARVSPRPRNTRMLPSSSTASEEKTFPGEDRILVHSPDVPTFDLKPEMSAYEVTDKVVEAIESDQVRYHHPQLGKLRHGWSYRHF